MKVKRRTATWLVLALAIAMTASPVRAQSDRPPNTTGTIPPRLEIVVTGDPASAEYLTGLIREAVARAVIGGTARIASIWPQPEPLERGFLTSFRVPVSVIPELGATTPGTAGAATPGSAVAAGTIEVDVENRDLAAFTPDRLAFADDPERIVADGVLSRATVRAGAPLRLYYYHENRGAARRFCVVLTANDSVRSHLQIVGARGGPNIDVMSDGHTVSKTFLARKLYNEGRVIEIAGGRPLLERDEPVAPGDGIVGALDVRVLDGGPVTATVLGLPPGTEPRQFLYGPKLPDDGHDRHGTFALAGVGQRIIAYTSGGPDATFRYGTRAGSPPNLDPADRGRDYGDYGVLQRIAFDLDNPAPGPVTLYLYEKPLGGAVRSSFAVNGRIVDVGCVRVPLPYRVASIDLAAHGTGRFDVVTMTDGGSNYPLELGVTATPPLPQTPPQSAPDGCFPKPARRTPPAQHTPPAQPGHPAPGH